MKLTLCSLFILLFSTSSLFGQIITRTIRPSDTDPLISTFDSDSNYVYIDLNVTKQNILVVHLPGSYGVPKRATYFGMLAASLGFHSIGLMYPNIPTVGSICTNSSDGYCYENVRREIIEGTDYTPDISINSTESIINRTEKLLVYLKTNYPLENWGQYLDLSNKLIFSKIIFSGHSQGGGHAAVIAKYFPIKRALCFSSPKDYSTYYNSPPLWYSTGNWQTPKSEIYSFDHTLDKYTQQVEILDSLGLDVFGFPVDVDNNSNPYNNTRELTTSYPVASGDEHGSTVQDTKTPKVGGLPVFLPVWTYMLENDLVAGIPEQIKNNSTQIIAYPNPVKNNVFIKLPNESFSVKIYDNTGKEISVFENQIGNSTFDLTKLNSGVYFIQAVNSNYSFFSRIIKQ